MIDKRSNLLCGIGRYTDLRFNYIFEGQWINGKKEGYGRHIWYDARYQLGTLKND